MSLAAKLKHGVRRVMPERWSRVIEQRFFRVRWTGDYPSWAAARADCAGYEEARLISRTAAAARAARDGRVAFDRDGVTFDLPMANEPLLDCLRAAAGEASGEIVVLDVGGAFGSAYWQHRRWLDDLRVTSWRVVELPAVVALGRREFADGRLAFFESVEEACAGVRPDVALLSSVLPYVADGRGLLESVARQRIKWVILDRTGVVEGARDRITVQRAPRSLHGASYPCRFYSRASLLASLADDYVLRREFSTPDGHTSGFEFKGFVFEHRI